MWVWALAGLLAAGSFLLWRWGYQCKQRAKLAVKKYGELSRRYQNELSGLDSILDTLNYIQQSLLNHPQEQTAATIASKVLDCACRISQVTRASFALRFGEREEAQVLATKGHVPLTDGLGANVVPELGFLGKVLANGKPLHIENLDTDARFLHNKESNSQAESALSQAGIHSLLVVPLLFEAKPWGVLALYSDIAHFPFEGRTQELLRVLADQSTLILFNLKLYHETQEFYLQMIESLTAILELKENVAPFPGRQEKLRRYAAKLAAELHLPETIVRHVQVAAASSVIGKMGIDDTILRKPGKLTPEEYAQIKRHPEISQQVVGQIKSLTPIAPMVLYCQERWDGKGYPAGLKGEEIPLGARIIAVVTAFVAMTSNRPYRQALSQTQAMQELRAAANEQFDPRVVDAFLRVLSKETGSLPQGGGNASS